jgi:hypothetical protein
MKKRVNSYITGGKKVDRVKVKLSLCLTKYHSMKTYPVFNETMHHEDIG